MKVDLPALTIPHMWYRRSTVSVLVDSQRPFGPGTCSWVRFMRCSQFCSGRWRWRDCVSIHRAVSTNSSQVTVRGGAGRGRGREVMLRRRGRGGEVLKHHFKRLLHLAPEPSLAGHLEQVWDIRGWRVQHGGIDTKPVRPQFGGLLKHRSVRGRNLVCAHLCRQFHVLFQCLLPLPGGLEEHQVVACYGDQRAHFRRAATWQRIACQHPPQCRGRQVRMELAEEKQSQFNLAALVHTQAGLRGPALLHILNERFVPLETFSHGL